MKRTEAGFTLVELITVIFALATILLGIFTAYWVVKVIVHFIAKFW